MDELNGIANGAVALGIGLLVGMERERHKGEGEDRAPEGLRTFALTAVLGYVCIKVGGTQLLAVMVLGLALMVAVAYFKSLSKDPGITSEIALLIVLVLGAQCEKEPALASALAVVLVLLLAYRQQLHHFVRHTLSEIELRDGLMLLAAALVILPLAPDQFMGPYAAFNPHTLCNLIVLLMAVGAVGHIAVRWLGARYGYAISAIASGFASSAATISAMGSLAKREPDHVRVLSAAALLSNLATLAQIALILGTVDLALMKSFWLPILAGGFSTFFYAGLLLIRSGRSQAVDTVSAGRAFDLKNVLLIGTAMTAITLLCAVLLSLFGQTGILAAALLGGLADAHAPTASIASLVNSGHLSVENMGVPILLAVSSNSLTKCLLAWGSGPSHFVYYVIPGQVLIMVSMWLALWF